MRKRSSRLIIFDYDGVLVDSLPVQFEIYRQLTKEMGLDAEQFDKATGGDFFNVDYRKTLERMGVTTPERIREAEERYLSHITAMRDQIKPFPFIADMLKTLSKDFTLAVVSNNNEKEIDTVLKSFGLRDFFDVIVGPPTHSILKPEPDQLLACLELTGAKDAIYVCDMDGDIEAAKRAGLSSIGVTWGFHSEKKMKSADFLVSTPEELITLVNDPKTFKVREEAASE